jgi:hypothetical protein
VAVAGSVEPLLEVSQSPLEVGEALFEHVDASGQ